MKFDILQSAVGYEYEGKTDKHASQKGMYVGYYNWNYCYKLNRCLDVGF